MYEWVSGYQGSGRDVVVVEVEGSVTDYFLHSSPSRKMWDSPETLCVVWASRRRVVNPSSGNWTSRTGTPFRTPG